jgi:hypothetical protein
LPRPFVVAAFDVHKPDTDTTNGRYLIKNALPSAWNREAGITGMQAWTASCLHAGVRLGGILNIAGSVRESVGRTVLDCGAI